MEVGKKASSRRGGGKPYDAAMQLHNLQNPVSSVSSDGAHRRRWQETKTSSALVGQEGGVDSGAHSQGSGEDLYEYREGQESVENNKPEFSDNTSLWIMGVLGDPEYDGYLPPNLDVQPRSTLRNEKSAEAREDTELLPRPVPSLDRVRVAQVSMGPFHAGVKTEDGDVYLWGANFCGQLGRGFSGSEGTAGAELAGHVPAGRPPRSRTGGEGSDPRPEVLRGLAQVKAYSGHSAKTLSCGGAHTIVVCREGVALSFGCNAFGALGLPSPPSASNGAPQSHEPLWSVPSPLHLPGVFVTSVSCGGCHTLLLSSSGAVFSFGSGLAGRLGHGDTRQADFPREVEALRVRHVTRVCAGWAHSMCIDRDGLCFTWGRGGNGRLGHGNHLDLWRPRVVDALARVGARAVSGSCAFEHSGVCCRDGSVWTWGLGEYGQLGVGTTELHAVPVRVRVPSEHGAQAAAISCGGAHTAVVTDRGELFSWGCGDRGQLGHGDRASLLEPRRVKALEGRLALAATCGWVGTLVVMSDEAVPPIPEGEAPSNGAPAALGAVGVDTLASNLTTPDVAVPAHVADSQDPRGDLENPTSLSALAESPQHGGSRKAASAPFRGGDAAQLVCSIAGERERDGVRFYRLVVRFCDHDFEIERRYTQFRSLHLRLQKTLLASLLYFAPGAARRRAVGPSSAPGMTAARPPPFPPRNFSLVQTRADDARQEQRLQDLQTYLDFVVVAPGAVSNSAIRTFLTLDKHVQGGTKQAAAAAWQSVALPASAPAAADVDPVIRSKSLSESLPSLPRSLSPGTPSEDRAGSENECDFEDAESSAGDSGSGTGVDALPRGRLAGDADDSSPVLNSRTGELSLSPEGRTAAEAAGAAGGWTSAAGPSGAWGRARARSPPLSPAKPSVLAVARATERPRTEMFVYPSSRPRSDSAGGKWVAFAAPSHESDAGKQAAATRLPRYPNPAMWQGYTFWVSEAAPSWDAHTRARRFLADFTVCPMSRGCIWPLAVGNTLHVNRDLFDILSRKARYAREQAPPGAPSPAEPFGREGSAQLVEHDLARTLAHLGLFTQAGPYAEELRRVLEAYCFLRPDVGYVQGMSFQAAILVLHCPDDYTAFVCLANLLSRPFFLSFYRDKTPALQQRMAIYDRVLEANLPDIHKHLKSVDVDSGMYCTLWFVTLFAKQLPVPLCALVWDRYLFQGESFMYRAAVGIIRVLGTRLRAMDTEEALSLLLGDISGSLPDLAQVFRSMEAVRMPRDAEQMLDRLTSDESVQEFKR